jgi:hypothetical protein
MNCPSICGAELAYWALSLIAAYALLWMNRGRG